MRHAHRQHEWEHAKDQQHQSPGVDLVEVYLDTSKDQSNQGQQFQDAGAWIYQCQRGQQYTAD